MYFLVVFSSSLLVQTLKSVPVRKDLISRDGGTKKPPGDRSGESEGE